MSNLLERASIVLTPTGFNNGEALCVKPDDGSGDFDFSRNSAATRVNSQGLVEDVQILSSNLVQNGDFSEQGAEEVSNGSFSQQGSELVTNGDFATDSDWVKGTGWTISGGTANAAIPVSSGLTASVGALTIGTTYKLTYTVSNYSAGNIIIQAGWAASGTSRNANGTYTEYLVCAGDTKVAFLGISSFIGSIDNVSVVEVGQDWTLSGGVSIGSNKAIFNATSQTLLYQNLSGTTQGTTYKVIYTISEYISGSIFFGFGNGITSPQGATRNADGTYTEYITKTDANISAGFRTNAFIGSITNISCKEVGQNWNLDPNTTIGDGQADFNYTGFSSMIQASPNLIPVVGNTYVISYEITEYTSGTFRLNFGGIETSSASVGVRTATIKAISTGQLQAVGSGIGFIGSVTNISVIEITEDTNLPRINYEGFSYQDALGSELVVNGGFDTDSNWSKGTGWSISDEKAIATNVPNLQRLQNTGNDASVIGKTYKYSISVSNVSGFYSFYVFGAYALASVSTEGTIEGYVTATSTNGAIFIAAATAGGLVSASIDNVSVKEYLGQEIIPNSGCGHWLWENQSTNLIPYSEDFSQWSLASGASINVNETISPNGTQNATKLNTLTAGSRVQVPLASLSGVNTISIFVKYAGDDATIRFERNTSNDRCSFDVSDTGVVFNSAESGIIDYKIEDFGNDWYRLSCVFDGGDYFQFNGDITGNGGSVYIWGANATNDQDYVTSYIPSNGTTVTRNQDVCTNNSIPALSGSHTVYADYKNYSFASGGNDRDWQSASGRVYLIYNYGGGLDVYNGSAFIVDRSTLIPATNFKIAIVTTPTTVKVFINGIDRTKAGALPNTTPITKWSTPPSGNVSQSLNSLVFFNEALSDEELTLLTTI